jgi:hypothetical protein
MIDENLESLLRTPQGTEIKATEFCPDDDRLAAYLDGRLVDAEHEGIERHMAACAFCADRVGAITRLLRDVGETGVVPDEALARALRLGRHRRAWGVPRWAAAAAVVLAVVGVSNWLPLDRQGIGNDQPDTRTLESTLPALEVIFPDPGLSVAAERLVFRWQPVEDSLHYDVRIVTGGGDLVVEQRTSQPEWELPDDLALSPDTEYYVRVGALMPDARTIRSEHVRFSVAEAE